jgi:hypothetical protein
MGGIMKKVLTVLALVAMSIVACSGKDGATGPQGPAGPGSRTVYESTTAIPTDGPWSVNIAEIDLEDMPLISVYISLPGDDLWSEIPLYVEGASDFGAACFFQEGQVTFVGCGGFLYKIVIVV